MWWSIFRSQKKASRFLVKRAERWVVSYIESRLCQNRSPLPFQIMLGKFVCTPRFLLEFTDCNCRFIQRLFLIGFPLDLTHLHLSSSIMPAATLYSLRITMLKIPHRLTHRAIIRITWFQTFIKKSDGKEQKGVRSFLHTYLTGIPFGARYTFSCAWHGRHEPPRLSSDQAKKKFPWENYIYKKS